MNLHKRFAWFVGKMISGENGSTVARDVLSFAITVLEIDADHPSSSIVQSLPGSKNPALDVVLLEVSV